jgi:hypothetical protein
LEICEFSAVVTAPARVGFSYNATKVHQAQLVVDVGIVSDTIVVIVVVAISIVVQQFVLAFGFGVITGDVIFGTPTPSTGLDCVPVSRTG